MSTEVRHNADADRFEVFFDGMLAGRAEYVDRSGRWVFTHTEIDDAYEGKGLGSALAKGALDEVRRRGDRVVALCPFLRGWIDRHDEYGDLVDEEMDTELR
ncbi:MAG: GNAT family N-acetyltransferase [Acidimicrobiia bacterium]